MQKHEQININKILDFKESAVLIININYPKFDFNGAKKINKFYAAAGKAFYNYCRKNLYKSAAANLLICERDAQIFKIFNAGINYEIKHGPEFIIIYLDININGKTARVSNSWSLSGELIKPKKNIRA